MEINCFRKILRILQKKSQNIFSLIFISVHLFGPKLAQKSGHNLIKSANLPRVCVCVCMLILFVDELWKWTNLFALAEKPQAADKKPQQQKEKKKAQKHRFCKCLLFTLLVKNLSFPSLLNFI